MLNKFKKLVPWLMCLAIFVFIFTKIHPSELVKSLALANIPLFLFYAFFYFLSVHVLDCLAIQHFISRFSAPITHKESWIARGVSYLIMILNYHAAQGAFAVYFKKTHKAPIAKTLGVLGFISIMDLLLVVTSAFIALIFSDVTYRGFDIRSFVLKLAPLLYLGYFLWILFWRHSERAFFNRFRKIKFIHWILNHDIFLIFRDAKWSDYFALILYRAPIIIVVVGGYKLAVASFQGSMSWVSVYLYNPIILFVSSIPLTPSGLGTSQVLTIEFFKNITTITASTANITVESLLLTSSLMWFLANQIIKALFGAVCLTRTSRKLFAE